MNKIDQELFGGAGAERVGRGSGWKMAASSTCNLNSNEAQLRHCKNNPPIRLIPTAERITKPHCITPLKCLLIDISLCLTYRTWLLVPSGVDWGYKVCLAKINFSSMSSSEQMILKERANHCYSSANRCSHQNRQKAIFEKNITQLEPKKQMQISTHVKVVKEMFSALAHTQDCKHGSKRKTSFLM